MYTTCALEAAYVYEYIIARKATYFSTSWLIVNLPMTVMLDLSDWSDVAMNIVMDAR